MPVLNRAFRLTEEPSIQPSTAKALSCRGEWLVFEGGSECLTLLQFCLLKQDKQPVLVIECQRGERGKGPYSYEDVRITGLAHGQDGVTVSTNLGPLYISPDKITDPLGKVITNIQVLREDFPMAEYLAFRREQLAAQENPPSPHLLIY